jgi:hypothetical protein
VGVSKDKETVIGGCVDGKPCGRRANKKEMKEISPGMRDVSLQVK